MNVTIPCLCPPTADGAARHESDTVTLYDALPFRQHLILANTIPQLYRDDPDAGIPELVASLVEAYVLNCISSWTLVDEHGKAVEVSKAEIRNRLMSHFEAAAIVGNVADDLYSERITAPLRAAASSFSQLTQTAPLTSPSPDGVSPIRTQADHSETSGPTKHPKRSKRSSTTSSLTVVTGPTASSPTGGSSTLPSSASAA